MQTIKTPSFELAVYMRGDAGAKRLALVIPGRLDTKDYPHMHSHVDFLARRGFLALSFDPPGTWESKGDISIYSTTTYLKAVKELIAYFGNRPTILLGHSRGASISMLLSSDPHVIGVILTMANFGAPVSPKVGAHKNGYDLSLRDSPLDSKKFIEFKLPLAYFEDGAQYNPAAALKTCTKPKLIVYGTKDIFSSPARAQEVFSQIPEPKVIYEVDCEHDYRRHPDVIDDVNRLIGIFLERELP